MDKIEELEKYKKLLDDGAITEDEFRLMKQKILGLKTDDEKAAETQAADTPDIAQLLVDKDAAFTVHQCLHALEEPYKEVFSLRVFGELPFDRIGAIFGHNAAWARVTYYRAKTRIQTMLEQRK